MEEGGLKLGREKGWFLFIRCKVASGIWTVIEEKGDGGGLAYEKWRYN